MENDNDKQSRLLERMRNRKNVALSSGVGLGLSVADANALTITKRKETDAKNQLERRRGEPTMRILFVSYSISLH
jgi:GTP cyclohydrolase III